jgi:hypothetical protein
MYFKNIGSRFQKTKLIYLKFNILLDKFVTYPQTIIFNMHQRCKNESRSDVKCMEKQNTSFELSCFSRRPSCVISIQTSP